MLFAVLLSLVRTAWAPLQNVDSAVADWFNSAVAGSDIVVVVLRGVTDFGGRGMLTVVLVAATGYLLIRRQPRLAVYVVISSLGALILDPVVKLLVERIRPEVADPVVTAPGPSFPSGHALGSLVSYGVLLLVFLPAVPPRRRRLVGAGVATLVALIGLTRVALGVHYVSDVVGGWALGVAWLGVTSAAFRRWQIETGRTATPAGEGPTSGAAAALRPTDGRPSGPAHPLLIATKLLVAAVLTVGAAFGAGVLVTTVLDGTALAEADLAAVQWFATQRTDPWTTVLTAANNLGRTYWIITWTLGASGIALALFRRWRPVVFLWTVMVGEVILFLITATVVTRARPLVQPLQPDLPPTASFPSGHVAGALCLYGATAILVWQATRSTLWRTVAVTGALVIPALVAVARLYRGVHHPTDIAGSILLTGLWLTASYLILHPGQDDDGGGRRTDWSLPMSGNARRSRSSPDLRGTRTCAHPGSRSDE
ncbi:phosphatase PAP2 family protein [Solwaraspora sp. WMMD1047]|uniref:phosphatase PAP2 family protein n=1 Tax=Solwaraspora sp. WMMD1047 TaxID=3016102 RepID=UPI0024163EEC|nr:phosphatase PAP2 family protein [Solwaraspora sp. WMMD1047]MDG4833469.1 phosphatase PAP2 family protein [Solwaraspora sp. WMMD1047]